MNETTSYINTSPVPSSHVKFQKANFSPPVNYSADLDPSILKEKLESMKKDNDIKREKNELLQEEVCYINHSILIRNINHEFEF